MSKYASFIDSLLQNEHQGCQQYSMYKLNIFLPKLPKTMKGFPKAYSYIAWCYSQSGHAYLTIHTIVPLVFFSWGWNWWFQICRSRQSFLCRHSHVLMFTCRQPMVTIYMVTSTTTSPLSVKIACHHMFSRFSDMNMFIRRALNCLPLVHESVRERGVYTVNYGTSTKFAKQWGKATTYILGLCVHYLVLDCSYL